MGSLQTSTCRQLTAIEDALLSPTSARIFITHIKVMAFSSLARILGEGHSFPASAFIYLFFLKCGSPRVHRFHFLGQDQSTVAQRDKTTVAKCSLTSCV